MSVLPLFQFLAFISKVNYFNIPIWSRGILSLCCDCVHVRPAAKKVLLLAPAHCRQGLGAGLGQAHFSLCSLWFHLF